MTIGDSLARVLSSDQIFGEAFYDEFFRRCPEVKPFFEGVDMQRQSLVLTMALSLVEQCFRGDYPAVEHYLGHTGFVHQRKGIPPELYPKWCETMLVALERFLGEDWSDALAEEWSAALEKASNLMLKGYDRHFGI